MNVDDQNRESACRWWLCVIQQGIMRRQQKQMTARTGTRPNTSHLRKLASQRRPIRKLKLAVLPLPYEAKNPLSEMYWAWCLSWSLPCCRDRGRSGADAGAWCLSWWADDSSGTCEAQGSHPDQDRQNADLGKRFNDRFSRYGILFQTRTRA